MMDSEDEEDEYGSASSGSGQISIKIHSDKPFPCFLKGLVDVVFSHISDFQGYPLNLVVFSFVVSL